MGKPTIDLGSAPGAGDGDPARTAYGKTNEGLEHGFNDDEDGEIAALTEKGTPVDADLVMIEDSAASNAKKKTQIGNFRGLNQSEVDARVVAVAPGVSQSDDGPANCLVLGPTITDDGVFVYDFGTDLSAGSLIASDNTGTIYGVFAIRAHTSSAICTAMVSSGITATTGILNGTTGSDGAMTVSTFTNNRLYVENRTGGARKVILTISRTQTP